MSYDRWGNKVLVRTRDGQVTACAYDERGRMVLRRLPSGVRQAFPQGGRLAISSGPTSDGSAFFRIRDTGFGIPVPSSSR